MASKQVTSRSRLLSSSPSPSPSFSSELIKHSTSTFQKSLLYVFEEKQGYRTVLGHIQLRVLRDKFTSFMFPPFFMSIAGALMKSKSAYLGLYKASLDSDTVVLSSGGLSHARHISAVRFVPASQLSLLWRTPWTYATFGRAYASAAESSKREIRVSDEADDDDPDDGDGEFEDDSDVEDEQRIEGSDYDYEEGEEEDQEPQGQVPAKKKIQTKPPKPKFPDQQGRVLNEKITARTLRLVNDDGKGHRIVSRDEALTLAKQKKMDLVQVDCRADPPVCKIYDFNREEYKQEQLLKDRKKQKGAMARLNEVKELRFNSKTEPKDLKMKVEQAKEFMNRGHRVKFVAIFKGKADDEKKRLEDEKMIDAIYPMVEDVAVIEQGPRVESRQAWVMLRHVKFASKKKPPKREPQIGAMERVESVKQEDQEGQVYSEPDFYQGQEENIMHEQDASSISETAAMARLQSYPSKLAAPSRPSFTFGIPQPQVQPAPPQDTVEAFSSEMYSPLLHGFGQHTKSLQGFGGSQGAERDASPPRGSITTIPTLQRGGQGGKIQSSRPRVSPQPASSLQGFEGAQPGKLQSSPLDGMLPPQSEQHASRTPKLQMFSMPPESPGILTQKQSPYEAPHPKKSIGSEVTQGDYPPAIARGRGIATPNQPPYSLASPTSRIELQGSPPNLRGPLLNLSQYPPMPPATHVGGPSNLQGPLPDASPSFSVLSSHQDGSINLESPLTDFFPSPPSPIPQRAPSFQASHQDPSQFVPSQNVQQRDSPPLQGSKGLPPQGVPRYSPLLQKFDTSPPQGVPRYPPPPIGQPRYTSPLGQPSFLDSPSPQGEFAPCNQNRQSQGPDLRQQMRSQRRPASDAAAPGIYQEQNYRPEQGQDKYGPPLNSFGSSQHTQQGPPNLFGSPQGPQHRPPNLFGSPQRPQQEPPNLFGSPQHIQQGPPNLFGSPQRPQQEPPNLFGSPQRPQQGPPNLFGSPQRPQQEPPNLFGSSQRPQQGPPNPFGAPQGPQQGPRHLVESPQGSQQEPPNLFGSPLRSQQGPPNLFGSPLRPQQGPPNLFRSPLRPEQGQSNLFGSPPHSHQGPPGPSQIQFGYQPVGVPQGPRQGGTWLSQQAPSRDPSPMPSHPQQAPSRDPSPMPSHPQQAGQPPSPSQGQQRYFFQQEAQGGGQNHWQSQAMQGYPTQQNQAPLGYPPQRGFPQTRLAQGAFGYQGNHPQNQASQESPPPRGVPQTRPVAPSRPGFRPSWSTPPQSQEYAPLFESPSDKP